MKPLRLAIVGCGIQSGGHAEQFARNPDVEIVALCDVSRPLMDSYIERHLPQYHPRPATHTDTARMYAEIQPDAVAIITPHTLHFEHGIQAIQSGCHVFMEKPMVTQSDQAHQLAAAVAKSGKIFVICYNTPCTPAFTYLREVIRSGELGQLQTVSGWQSQGWLQATMGLWRQNPALSGGGMMFDSGAHMFNSLVWSIEQPIESVYAFVDNLGTQVDINGTVNIRFQGGTLATMAIAGNSSSLGAGMVYVFERGRIEVDGWLGKWIKVFHDQKEIEPQLPGGFVTPGENFVNAVLGREAPRTSPINGVIQAELMDAIYESARTGQAATPCTRK